MITQTLDAVFEDGSFKPLDNGSLPFSEGQRVKLTVEFPSETEDNLVALAGPALKGGRGGVASAARPETSSQYRRVAVFVKTGTGF